MEGIVVKSIDFKENSKIIYLLTENGKDSLLVKGAKSIKNKNVGLTQSITLINYNHTNSNLKILTDGEVINNYDYIKESIDNITIASELLEITTYFYDSLVSTDQIYKSVKVLLSLMKDIDPLKILLIYKAKLIKFLGGLLEEDILKEVKEYVSISPSLINKLMDIPLIELLKYDFSVQEIKDISFILDYYFDKYYSYKPKTINMRHNLFGF